MNTRDNPDDALAAARIDLTVALRMASRLGLGEGICNHFSLVAPGSDNLFCINPQGLHWSELTPADIVVADSQGNIVSGKHKIEPTAFFIHQRIHSTHPRARCVMHSHMPYATALSSLDKGRLEPISQNALRFYGKVAYDNDYNALALDASEGERIAQCLGDATVLFLANHGVVVCDDSVASAFDDLYYLERACMLQVLAQSTGQKLAQIPRAVAEKTVQQFDADRTQQVLHFDALKRLLDRDEPGWRGAP